MLPQLLGEKNTHLLCQPLYNRPLSYRVADNSPIIQSESLKKEGV